MKKENDSLKDILEKLEALSNPENVAGMTKFGIKSVKTYGVHIPDLRKIAKTIGKNHRLALQLWNVKTRETRILASMIDSPEGVPEDQMESWVKEFDNWETCDQVCQNLFTHTSLAYQKAVEWSQRKEEFIKRAGFVIMARLAVKDKKAEDKEFEKFLPIIKREAADDRNYVKKAVSWALRQIGKRNLYLNKKAIETAREIEQTNAKSAKWIARDALKELTNYKIQQRLQRKTK